jgi:hypothetical protein
MRGWTYGVAGVAHLRQKVHCDWRSDNLFGVRGRQRQAARGVDTGDTAGVKLENSAK